MNEYEIVLKTKGKYITTVCADNEQSAKETATNKWLEADFGELKDIEYEFCSVNLIKEIKPIAGIEPVITTLDYVIFLFEGKYYVADYRNHFVKEVVLVFKQLFSDNDFYSKNLKNYYTSCDYKSVTIDKKWYIGFNVKIGEKSND